MSTPPDRPGGPFAPAHYLLFYAQPPAEETAGARTWYARGQSMVVAYSETAPGAVLERSAQDTEYCVLVPDEGSAAVVQAGRESVAVDGFSLAFVPPGESSVTLPAGGPVVRLFTLNADLADRCGDWDDNPRIPPVQLWPDPPGEPRVRVYSLATPPGEGCFGRIYRGRAFMINYIEPSIGPRDPSTLSPHHHDDFEQCSLALEGDFVHHLRWPWTANRHHWREDEHVPCGSPSVAIIPPPAIHTTEATGPGRNVLVDVFCPPRLDFSQRPGWVLNAEDYPLPETLGVA
jgi:hypothetical protein